MIVEGKPYRTVWMEGSTVRLIDQHRLPHFFEIADMGDHRATARAIKDMVVRGAGAIGAAAGFGMAQVALEAPDEAGFTDYVTEGYETLRRTRPTAQNLFYAINKVKAAVEAADTVSGARRGAVEVAQAIADEDAACCQTIGQIGSDLLRDGTRLLTHCNAGWLAFVDWGTALAPVYAAKRQGKRVFVFADETRPRCQGASLTAWELVNEGIDHAIIADNASGYMMRRGEVDLVIVGSDRIAANGDVVNKIGTYEKAVLAHELGIPFYVAAPTSTIDLATESGDAVPIEERGQDEVLYVSGLLDDGRQGRVRLAPARSQARNPGFDITPAKYVRGIITQHGIFAPNRIAEAVTGY